MLGIQSAGLFDGCISASIASTGNGAERARVTLRSGDVRIAAKDLAIEPTHKESWREKIAFPLPLDVALDAGAVDLVLETEDAEVARRHFAFTRQAEDDPHRGGLDWRNDGFTLDGWILPKRGEVYRFALFIDGIFACSAIQGGVGAFYGFPRPHTSPVEIRAIADSPSPASG